MDYSSLSIQYIQSQNLCTLEEFQFKLWSTTCLIWHGLSTLDYKCFVSEIQAQWSTFRSLSIWQKACSRESLFTFAKFVQVCSILILMCSEWKVDAVPYASHTILKRHQTPDYNDIETFTVRLCSAVPVHLQCGWAGLFRKIASNLSIQTNVRAKLSTSMDLSMLSMQQDSTQSSLNL